LTIDELQLLIFDFGRGSNQKSKINNPQSAIIPIIDFTHPNGMNDDSPGHRPG